MHNPFVSASAHGSPQNEIRSYNGARIIYKYIIPLFLLKIQRFVRVKRNIPKWVDF